MRSFENLRIVDNFYQTFLFFTLPTVIISTLCPNGSTTLGLYSLVQPLWSFWVECSYCFLVTGTVYLYTIKRQVAL